MKRYVLFAGEQYSEWGGMGEFVAMFDDVASARYAVRRAETPVSEFYRWQFRLPFRAKPPHGCVSNEGRIWDASWWQIIDIETLTTVAEESDGVREEKAA